VSSPLPKGRRPDEVPSELLKVLVGDLGLSQRHRWWKGQVMVLDELGEAS